MGSKANSFEDKVKLPVTETISRFYQPQGNRKAIRILTVAVYVLCVSLAAIMLSLYYIFIWDPTVKTFIPGKISTNCDKFIIPEQVAIRLTNSTEISASQFYRNILRHYQYKQRANKKQYTHFASATKLMSALSSTSKIIVSSTPSIQKTLDPIKIVSEDDEDYSDDLGIMESSGQFSRFT